MPLAQPLAIRYFNVNFLLSVFYVAWFFFCTVTCYAELLFDKLPSQNPSAFDSINWNKSFYHSTLNEGFL